MHELVRAAALTAFPEVSRAFGLDPQVLLSAVGIDGNALGDPEMRIPAAAVGRLLEMAAQQSKVETFGLHMAETRSLAILGPIGLLVREEPTARHAIHSLARYLMLHNESLALRLDQVEDQAILSLEIHLEKQQPFRQGVELSIGVLYRILQPLLGRDWQPIVCFAHDPPTGRDVHRRFFGPRVDFRCNYNGLIFPAYDLDKPVQGSNPVFAEHARRYLQSLMDRRGDTLEAKLRELVRAQLSSGRCTVDRLANQVGCDRRTLQRKLALEQVTFNAIIDSVRSELAVRLLQNREANLELASDMLGFSSASAFSRWFLAAFGKRPSEWRKDLEVMH